MAERWEGRGSPPRMPGDDSSPIPIYFLSLMLLKSPTYSANRERAQGSGGRRGLGAEWRATEVIQADARGPETWVQIPLHLHLPTEPWGKPALYLCGE